MRYLIFVQLVLFLRLSLSLFWSKYEILVGLGQAARSTRMVFKALREESMPKQFGVGYHGSSSYPTDTNVVFGSNALEIGIVDLENFGVTRPFVLTGWNAARADPVFYELEPRGFQVESFCLTSEPYIDEIVEAAHAANLHSADCIIAVGGGSVMDAAKLVSIITYSRKSPELTLKTLIENSKFCSRSDLFFSLNETSPLPVITIPMVPGAGSEVNGIAVIYCKKEDNNSMRIHLGVPGYGLKIPPPFMCLAEPRITRLLSAEHTWLGAFIALSGLIDGFLASKGFLNDMLCCQHLQALVAILSEAPSDTNCKNLKPYREPLLLASIVSGMARSHSGLSLCHLGAVVLGALYGVPYAIGVANLVSPVLSVTLRKLMVRDDEKALLADIRAKKLAELITGKEGADAWDSVVWLKKQVKEKGFPGLANFKVKCEDAAEFGQAWADEASSLEASTTQLFQLTAQELASVLVEALKHEAPLFQESFEGEEKVEDPGIYDMYDD